MSSILSQATEGLPVNFISCKQNTCSILFFLYFIDSPGLVVVSMSLCSLQDEYKSEPGTVIAADFYHSNTLMPLSHEEIVHKVKSNLDQCEPSFRSAQVRL